MILNEKTLRSLIREKLLSETPFADMYAYPKDMGHHKDTKYEKGGMGVFEDQTEYLLHKGEEGSQYLASNKAEINFQPLYEKVFRNWKNEVRVINAYPLHKEIVKLIPKIDSLNTRQKALGGPDYIKETPSIIDSREFIKIIERLKDTVDEKEPIIEFLNLYNSGEIDLDNNTIIVNTVVQSPGFTGQKLFNAFTPWMKLHRLFDRRTTYSPSSWSHLDEEGLKDSEFSHLLDTEDTDYDFDYDIKSRMSWSEKSKVFNFIKRKYPSLKNAFRSRAIRDNIFDPVAKTEETENEMAVAYLRAGDIDEKLSTWVSKVFNIRKHLTPEQQQEKDELIRIIRTDESGLERGESSEMSEEYMIMSKAKENVKVLLDLLKGKTIIPISAT